MMSWLPGLPSSLYTDSDTGSLANKTAVTGWCGAIQICFRDSGSTKAHHHAFLRLNGDAQTFGSANAFTATALQNRPAPRRSRPSRPAGHTLAATAVTVAAAVATATITSAIAATAALVVAFAFLAPACAFK
ncbi:hypothetical protein T492DRAFT_860946 [Pavlovales sp. CCMP2436]|nr:hypothetical protein T492DRAFT_860946 [Pavlovales sp. CCMP2436]